jgi:hypothetical protein
MAARSVRFALAVLLAACFQPSYSDQTRCSAAMECPPGRMCVNGFCHASSISDAPLGGPDGPMDGPDGPMDGPDAPPDAPDGGGSLKITITKTGATAATGTFTYIAASTPTQCAAGCPGVTVNVPPDTIVMIAADAASGSYFLGYGAPCPGPARLCMFAPTQSVALAPRYERIDRNLMFVTSKTFDFPNSGTGLAAADALCRAAASQSGLAGTYVAILSDDVTGAAARLVKDGTTARGFVRLDGLPIADTVSNLLVEHRLWYPVAFDEHGTLALRYAWNGTNLDGSPSGAAADCSSWTDSGGTGLESHTGSNLVAPFTENCSMPRPVVCAGVDHGAAVNAPVVTPGKLVFVTSSGWMGSGGLAAAAALCSAEQPEGHATMPLLATTSAAAAILDSAQLYVRPDGVPVGTGAELASSALRTGIWVHGDGSAAGLAVVWTGSDDPTNAATDNCVGWSSSGFLGVAGTPVAGPEWWSSTSEPCSQFNSVYCIEP